MQKATQGEKKYHLWKVLKSQLTMWCLVINKIVIVIVTAITKKAEWVLEGYNPVVTTGTA